MKKTSVQTLGVYLGVLLIASTLYVLSCAPGALWQDSGLIQYRTWHNDIEGFSGLALAHPLFYLLAIGAKFTGLGEFGYRVNLVSALAGAVAVANLYLLVRLWLGAHFPALIAAATLALSHTFWQHASIAETYTLWTALFLGELIVLLQYTLTKRVAYLYALGLLNGLALAVHMLAVIPLACYLAWLLVLLAKKEIRLSNAAVVGLLWVVGALPYEYLIVRHIVSTGDVLGTLASACFGDRWRADVLNVGLPQRIVGENLLLLLYNLPTPNVLLFCAGLVALGRIVSGLGFRRIVGENFLLLLYNFPTPNILLFFAGLVALGRMESGLGFRRIVSVLMILFLVFAFRYTVSDRYAFFIPFYSLAAAIVGVGTYAVRQRLKGKAIVVLIATFTVVPVAVYAVAPACAKRMHLSLGTRADIAYRDDYTYFLQPWKTGCDGPERFAREGLTVAGRDAIIYADSTTVAPLLYGQEVGDERPDVKIVTGRVSSEGAPAYGERAFQDLVGRRPVYVTSNQPDYVPEFILHRYELVQNGPLWRVTQSSCGAD